MGRLSEISDAYKAGKISLEEAQKQANEYRNEKTSTSSSSSTKKKTETKRKIKTSSSSTSKSTGTVNTSGGGYNYNVEGINRENEFAYLRGLYVENGASGKGRWALEQAEIYGMDITKDPTQSGSQNTIDAGSVTSGNFGWGGIDSIMKSIDEAVEKVIEQKTNTFDDGYNDLMKEKFEANAEKGSTTTGGGSGGSVSIPGVPGWIGVLIFGFLGVSLLSELGGD